MTTDASSVDAVVKSQQQGWEVLQKLVAVAQPGAVFSEPVTSGDHTVITASEVSVGMGFGFGMGGGRSPRQAEQSTTPDEGFGGGGGGGGGSLARPVAVISVGPSGVEVHPVIDRTKLGITALVSLGAVLLMAVRLRGKAR